MPALEGIWPGTPPRSPQVAFSPDGEQVAMAIGKDEVQCFRTDTGRPVGPPARLPDEVGNAMAFAPDGLSLWVATPRAVRADQTWLLHRLDPASGRPIQPPIQTTGPFYERDVAPLVFTPDGRYVIGAVLELHPDDRGRGTTAEGIRVWRTGSILVWEATSGRLVRKVDVNSERAWAGAFLGLSPDGESVIAWICRGGHYEGTSFRVDSDEPPRNLGRFAGPQTPMADSYVPGLGNSALHFQNQMQTALVIGDGQIHRWSFANPGVLGPGVPTPFRSMHDNPSADGRSVIVPTEGRVFDTGAWPPRPSGVRFAHPGWLNEGTEQCSPDGRFVATWPFNRASLDRRLWRLPRPHSRPPLPPAERARRADRGDGYMRAEFDSRGEAAVLWSREQADVVNTARIVDVATGSARDTYVLHSDRVRDVAIAPDGRHFATGGFDSTARVWETTSGRPAGPPLPHTNWVAAVAFSPDGNTLAAGDYGPQGLVKLWDWRTGKETRPPLPHDDIILSVSFSPDGRFLAALKTLDWSKHPELVLWEIDSRKAVFRAPLNCPRYPLRETPRFRPDGRAVAVRDAGGVLHLWEAPSGQVLGERPLDGDGVTRFSPDGRVVAATVNLGVRLLDGANLAPLPGGSLTHPHPIQDVAFSPDGAFLLTAHETGSAQLWDVASRKPIGPPAVLIGPILAVSFTPDSRTCLCVAADGTVRRWPVPAPFAEPDLARLADRIALMTGQRMDESHGLDYLPTAAWQALRAKLVGEGSTAMVPARPDADWHDAVADDAEQDRDAFGAEWHLARLAVSRPDDWTIPARRGRVLMAAGRKDEAGAAYATASRLAPSPQVISDWHRAVAADDETAGRKGEALWNLDRAVALTPDDWALYVRRANLADPDRAVADLDEAIRRGAEPGLVLRAAHQAAESGDWKRAAALFGSAGRGRVIPTMIRHHQALACLKDGDVAGYREACAGIAGQLPPVGPKLSAGEANNAAMIFALGPGATDDWTKPLAWIEHALGRLTASEEANNAAKDQIQQARHMFLNTRGAVLYRAGRHAEAAKALRDGMGFDPGGGVFEDWLFLALAEQALGHDDAAKEAAAKARAAKTAAKAGPVWAVAEVELLDAELDAALPPPGK